MKPRPVRPNIYLLVVRFGVADRDWFSVLLISCAGYLAPVPFGVTILYVPLQMWTWLLATAGSIAFFNYIRIGKRPCWIEHKFKAVTQHHRQYRTIPNGRKRAFRRAWLIHAEGNQPQVLYAVSPANHGTQTALLLENNDQNEESDKERWNALLPVTN